MNQVIFPVYLAKAKLCWLDVLREDPEWDPELVTSGAARRVHPLP